MSDTEMMKLEFKIDQMLALNYKADVISCFKFLSK